MFHLLIPTCEKCNDKIDRLCIKSNCLDYPFLCAICQNQHQHIQYQIITWRHFQSFWNCFTAIIQSCYNNLIKKISRIFKAHINTIEFQQIPFKMTKIKKLVPKCFLIILENLQNRFFKRLTSKDINYFYNYCRSPNLKIIEQQLLKCIFTTIERQLQTIQTQFSTQIFNFYNQLLKYDKFSFARLSIARFYKRFNMFQQSIFQYGKIIEKGTDKRIAYEQRTQIFWELKLYLEALKDCNSLIQLFPCDSSYYLNRGVLYKEMDLLHQALEDYSLAICIDQKCIAAYNKRALIYNQWNQHDEALKDLTRAIQINPQDPESYCNKGFIYHQIGNYQKSEQNFNKAIEIKYNDTDSLLGRGDLFQNLGKYEKAIEDFTTVIKKCFEIYEGYEHRGIIYYKTKNYDLAKSDFYKSIELNEKQCDISYYYLGLIQLNNRNYKQSIKYIKKAITIKRKDIYFLYRGIAYDCLGYNNKAANDYQKCFKFSSEGTVYLKQIYKYVDNDHQ